MIYGVFRRPFTDSANLPMPADAFAAVRLRDMGMPFLCLRVRLTVGGV